MELLGRFQNGVVILEGSPALPEGAVVGVTYPLRPAVTSPARKRVEFPLVHSELPGSLHLTNERIQEILDEEDREGMKGQWNVPS
jgi:hypothetical protein